MQDLSKLKKTELIALVEQRDKAIVKWCEKADSETCSDSDQYTEGLLKESGVLYNKEHEMQIDAKMPSNFNPEDIEANDCKLIINGEEYPITHIGDWKNGPND